MNLDDIIAMVPYHINDSSIPMIKELIEEMNDNLKDIISDFTSNNKLFTSLDITNAYKLTLDPMDSDLVRHSHVSPIVRKAFDDNDYIFLGYTSTDIDVDAEFSDDNGNLVQETRKTLLYHPHGADITKYTNTNARVGSDPSNVIDTGDVIDADDIGDTLIDDADTEITDIVNDPDGAYSYQTEIHIHGVSIYLDPLRIKGLDNCSFDMQLSDKEIRINKVTSNHSVVTTTKLGHLRISNSDLTRSNLISYDNVWVHIYNDHIIINELNPIVMALRKHIGHLVKFKVETPTSNVGDTVQTVIMKFIDVSATKDCNYVLHGYTLKRLIDDADDISGSKRQYRVDRIDFSTFIDLEI
jgi:hypothetical protein